MNKLVLVPVLAAVLAGGSAAPQDKDFFNGKDLTGWESSVMKYWSVEDGAIVGKAEEKVPKNIFLWSRVKVTDFYLSVSVKLEPNERNAGIQIRSRAASEKDPHGQAVGYQADIGRGVWGRIYHEHGRGALEWRGMGEKAIKPGEWNHYEILAVGPRIWIAINGTLSAALKDPEGERSGKIALQIHSGPPQTVRYKILKLVHDPKVELAGKNEEELNAALIPPRKPKSKR